MSSRRDFLKQMGVLAASAAIPSSISAMASGGAPGETTQLKNTKIALNSDWDVIVIGGGPGGCTAAISAAREGAKTLIIETSGKLGGMGTSGLVPAWCPMSDQKKLIYRGLAKTIFNESKKGVLHEERKKLDWVSINPEHLMWVYDNLVTESGAKVLFFSRVCGVEKSANDTVDAVIVANKSGLTAFKAKVFIDATGDGDVAAWAGADFERGFTKGKEQSSSLCFEIGNIDSYDYIHGPLLFNGAEGVIQKCVQSGRYPLIDGHFYNTLIANDTLGVNGGHMDLDTTDPWKVSHAMIKGRKIAREYLQAMKDFRPTTFGSAHLVRTGDVLGTRESRRIIGDYMLTVDDWLAKANFDDEIGRNCYYIDIHGANESHHYKPGESHGIPYRCLTPKSLKNLLTAGRCISVDGSVFGSTRIMPCCMVTGEAAGMAAKHAIDQSNCDVHKIDTYHLRSRLKEEGQYII